VFSTSRFRVNLRTWSAGVVQWVSGLKFGGRVALGASRPLTSVSCRGTCVETVFFVPYTSSWRDNYFLIGSYTLLVKLRSFFRLWGRPSLLSNGYRGAPSPRLKLPAREGDHLLPSRAEVKNAWNFTSSPPYVLMTWCSVEHGDNFCFILYQNITSKTQHSTLLFWCAERIQLNGRQLGCISRSLWFSIVDYHRNYHLTLKTGES
jgi:hypothetical protein